MISNINVSTQDPIPVTFGATPASVTLGRGQAAPTVRTITETAPSSAITAAGANVVSGLGAFENVTFRLVCGGNTGGTLNVYVQHSSDGVDFIDYVAFPTIAAGTASASYTAHMALNGQVLLVGTGLSPVLPPATIAGGVLRDLVRLVMVSGASTTVGAAISLEIVGHRLLV